MTEVTATMPVIKCCIDRTLPTTRLLPASRAAIAENPANAPAIPRGSQRPSGN